MTLLTAGALTDPRLPATASNVCTTDARLGGVGRMPPPQTKILATPVSKVELIFALLFSYVTVMDRDGWSGKFHLCSLVIKKLLQFQISL